MEKQVNYEYMLNAEDALCLTQTSVAFKNNIFKEIKHAAITGHDTLLWDVSNINKQLLTETIQLLTNFGYTIGYPYYTSFGEDENYMEILWQKPNTSQISLYTEGRKYFDSTKTFAENLTSELI